MSTKHLLTVMLTVASCQCDDRVLDVVCRADYACDGGDRRTETYATQADTCWSDAETLRAAEYRLRDWLWQTHQLCPPGRSRFLTVLCWSDGVGSDGVESER